MASVKRKRGGDPPEVGDRVRVKYKKWEEGKVTRVEGGEFWVAYDGGEGEFAEPVSSTRNLWKVLVRRKWVGCLGPPPNAREQKMVEQFVEVVDGVPLCQALIYIRRGKKVGGGVEGALEIYYTAQTRLEAFQTAAAATAAATEPPPAEPVAAAAVTAAAAAAPAEPAAAAAAQALAEREKDEWVKIAMKGQNNASAAQMKEAEARRDLQKLRQEGLEREREIQQYLKTVQNDMKKFEKTMKELAAEKRAVLAAAERQAFHKYGPDNYPDEYKCIISQRLMEEPMILRGSSAGHSYEEDCILRHIESEFEQHGRVRDPMTREILYDYGLIPNRALKASIEEYKAERDKWEREQDKRKRAAARAVAVDLS